MLKSVVEQCDSLG